MGTMEVAELSFTIMKYLGIYQPMSWTSQWTIRLYNTYKCFMFTYIYLTTLAALVNMCQNFDDFSLLTENAFIFSTLLVLSFKITYISIYRENIINFKNMFIQNQCNSRDSHEILIRKNCYKTERSNLRLFIFICLTTTAFSTIGPIIMKGKHVMLPFRSWIPNHIRDDIKCGNLFWTIYILQSLGMLISMLMFTATELPCSVMMQQICAQLEIMMHRLLALPELAKNSDSWINIRQQELKIIKDCITHHNYIFTIQGKLNHIFGFMAFIQFFSTTINLCTVIYQLSKMTINHFKFWSLTGILTCFVMQILTYCWYGDEMIAKSEAVADAIYTMNWTHLTKDTKKSLIIIMIRASRPVKLRGASLITMSLNTFIMILKTSYSFFNLMRSV